MIKHIIAIVVLSLLIILTMSHVQTLLQALLSAHDWIATILKEVFSDGATGNATRELLASLAIPFIAGLIPAALYWLAKRSWFPYFMSVVWVVWLIQTSALVIQYKMA
jgi:hypothetical protein